MTDSAAIAIGTHPDEQPGWGAAVAALVLFVLPFVYLPPGRFLTSTTYYYTYLKLTLFQTVAAVLWTSMLFRGGIVEALHRARALLLPAAALCAWGALTLLWSPWRWAGAHPLVEQASYLVGAIALMYLLANRLARRVFAVLLGISAGAAAVVISAVYFYAQAKGFNSLFFANPNLAGGFLVLPAMVAMVFLFREPEHRAERPLMLVLLLLCTLGMVATSCRGAVLAILVGAVVLAAVKLPRWRKLILGAAAIAAIAAIAVLWTHPTLASDLFGIRLLIWKGTLATASQQPILGHGLGSYFIAQTPNQPAEYFAHPLHAEVTIHAHSQPLEVWAELGFVGLALLAWLIVSAVGAAFRKASDAPEPFDRTLALGLGCGVVAMFAHGLVEVTPYYPDVQISFWIAVAFLGGMLIDAVPQPLPLGESRWTRGWRIYAWGCLIVLLWWIVAARGASVQHEIASGSRESWAARSKQELDTARFLLYRAAAWPLCEPIAGLTSRAKIANILVQLGYVEAAIEQQRAIERRAPNVGQTQYRLARLLAVTSQWADAAKYLKSYCAVHYPGDPEVYRIWLEVIQQLDATERPGAIRAVIDHLTRAIEAEGSSPVLWLPLARALYDSGDKDRAGKALLEGAQRCQKAIQDRPNDEPPARSEPLYDAWLTMDYLASEYAPGTKAGSLVAPGLELLEGDVKRQGATLRLAYLLGEYYRRLGDEKKMAGMFSNVAAACQRILAFRSDIDAMEILARMYQQMNPQLAEQICLQMLKLQPGHPAATSILANIARRKPPQPTPEPQKQPKGP